LLTDHHQRWTDHRSLRDETARLRTPMLLDVEVRVLQVVSAWCLSRQHPKKMELTAAFESENVVDGNVYAYSLTTIKYRLDGRDGCAQGGVLSNLSPKAFSADPWPYTTMTLFTTAKKYVISLTRFCIARYKPQSRVYRGVGKSAACQTTISN
jgi:hypothetical protein